VLETRIDALDLSVLKGGADVAAWAHDHGFRLSPDAPEGLDFYAQRSPIFLAAIFDGDAAAQRGQQVGDGTRSTSRSRCRTRGCRCASWAWASSPPIGSTRTSSC
jgi:hypothetical protein